MDNSYATLSNSGKNYSTFQVGDLVIRFYTSPYLERYCSVDKWENDGYIVYTGKFSTKDEPVEDYIDLACMAERLHLPDDVFKGVKDVRIV